RHAALHGHAERRHGGELHGVVGRLEDRLREVLAHFARIDVEGGGELDVADVVTTEPRVHEPGDEPVVRRLTIVVDALDQRGSAITDADDGNSDGSHGWPPGSDGALAAARGRSCVSVAQRRVKSRKCTIEKEGS